MAAGTGRYVSALTKAGFRVTGVDISAGCFVATSKLGPRGPTSASGCSGTSISSRIIRICGGRTCSWAHHRRQKRSCRDRSASLLRAAVWIVTDLDPEHTFDTTRIWTPEGTIRIPFAKREPQALLRLAESAGTASRWSKKSACYRMCLAFPIRQRIASIDITGARPVFYVMTLVPRMTSQSGSA